MTTPTPPPPDRPPRTYRLEQDPIYPDQFDLVIGRADAGGSQMIAGMTSQDLHTLAGYIMSRHYWPQVDTCTFVPEGRPS